MAGEEPLERSEAEALLATRRELGAQYDRDLVESFADRIERTVQDQVESRMARRGADQRAGEGGRIRQFVLGIVSCGVGVPITIVPTVAPDSGPSLAAVAIAWLGIAAVNAAHAATVNGPRRHD